MGTNHVDLVQDGSVILVFLKDASFGRLRRWSQEYRHGVTSLGPRGSAGFGNDGKGEYESFRVTGGANWNVGSGSGNVGQGDAEALGNFGAGDQVANCAGVVNEESARVVVAKGNEILDPLVPCENVFREFVEDNVDLTAVLFFEGNICGDKVVLCETRDNQNAFDTTTFWRNTRKTQISLTWIQWNKT